MTYRIHVLEHSVARPARTEALASSDAVLTLLGCGSGHFHELGTAPLGDALAAVAAKLGIEPTANVLASALVCERESDGTAVGEVLSVGDVSALLACATDQAGDVLLVADSGAQADSVAERLRAAAPARPPSSIVGVLTLGEACERLLDFGNRARAGTLVPADCAAVARGALFEGAVHASRVALEWGLVADIAAGISATMTRYDVRTRFELDFVRDVARRHEGWSVLLPWPEEDELAPYTEDVRYTILAHVVQSASDGGNEQLRDYAERAAAAVQDASGEGARKLRGALGRARAAAGDFEGASMALSATVDEWLAERSGEASRPLCELLRVDGILGRGEAVTRWREVAESQLSSELDAESRRYVDLAIGRALVQVGRPDEALAVLGRDSLRRARPHVQRSALRWRARAARELGNAPLATECDHELDALGDSDQKLLAELDRGLASVEATTACLEAMLALPADGAEVRAHIARLAPGVSLRAVAERPDVLRRLRDEYRY